MRIANSPVSGLTSHHKASFPGRCAASNPEISSFPVWSFGPSRNDGDKLLKAVALHYVAGNRMEETMKKNCLAGWPERCWRWALTSGFLPQRKARSRSRSAAGACLVLSADGAGQAARRIRQGPASNVELVDLQGVVRTH